jgi:hypothetical protein
MEWYFWLIIAWVISGIVALGLEFRSNSAMRENVGLADVWPVIFGPGWLALKLWQLIMSTEST